MSNITNSMNLNKPVKVIVRKAKTTTNSNQSNGESKKLLSQTNETQLSSAKKRKNEVDELIKQYLKPIEQMDYLNLVSSACRSHNLQNKYAFKVYEDTEPKRLIPVVLKYLLCQVIPRKDELPIHWIEKQQRRFYARLFGHVQSQIRIIYPILRKDVNRMKYKDHEKLWLRGRYY